MRRRDHTVDGGRPAAPQRVRGSAGCDRRGSSPGPRRERAGGRRSDQAVDENRRSGDDHHRGLLEKAAKEASFHGLEVMKKPVSRRKCGRYFHSCSRSPVERLLAHRLQRRSGTGPATVLLVVRFAKSIFDISTMALVRLRTLSLRRISETWTFTVVSEILSS